MSRLESDLRRLLNKLDKDRTTRETKITRELLKIYEEARKELYIKFLEAQGGKDTLKLQFLEGILRDIEKQMKHYTDLTAEARQTAIDEAFLYGQEVGAQMLTAGGVDISVAAGIGLINRGMVEALIGDVPKLAGRVEDQILFRIRDELTKGAVMGESIPKIAKRILGTGLTQDGLKKPFSSIKARAQVIARTEIIKASDAGYEDLAAKAQESIGEEIYDAWITAGDGRVDSECRAIANGTDPRFKSIPGYPGVYRREGGPRPVISTHPRCRCRRVPFLISWAESGALRLEELKGRDNNSHGQSEARHKLYVEIPGLNNDCKNGLAKAWEDALEFGRANNRETLKTININNGDSAFMDLHGDDSSVKFTPELMTFLENGRKNSFVSVHNHPSSSSFSDADLNILSTYESIQYLAVVGHDETRYLVRVGNGRRVLYNEIRSKYNELKKKYFNYFAQKVRNGELTNSQAWKEHSHKINEDLAAEFGWEYKRVMPDEQE